MLLTHCMCQVWASMIPAPWWVIKHIWSISAFPMRPLQPARGYVLILNCWASPATCTFFKINLSHIWGQETARLSATSIWAQWFEHYQKGRVRNGTNWIACELPHHVLLLVFFVTGRQALEQWYVFFFVFFFYFASVILVISLSHHRWLEVLTTFPVYDMSLCHVLLSTERYSKLIPSGPLASSPLHSLFLLH